MKRLLLGLFVLSFISFISCCNPEDSAGETQIEIPNEEELMEKYGKPYKEDELQFRPIHAHNIALRKMRKLFLAHYWEASRELNGLPVREPYAKDKLQHKNIISWKQAIKYEKQMP